MILLILRLLNLSFQLSNMSIKTGYPDKVDISEELEAEAARVRSSIHCIFLQAGNTFFDSMLLGTVAVYTKSISRLRAPVDKRYHSSLSI